MGIKIIITVLTIILSIMNSEPEKGNNTIIINDVNKSVIQDFKKYF